MPGTKHNSNSFEQMESTEEKQQMILFFKSYLRYVKHLISNTSSLKKQNGSIFDLKKTSVSVSLELFLQRILSYFKCGIEAYICALCFIDRLLSSEMEKTDTIVLSIKNIFKILSVALLISTKNFDDFYYSNAYYARVCGLTLQQLNVLEKEFLKKIDFDVFVDGEDYKVYETRINGHKKLILEEIFVAKGKENLIDEQNRSLNQKMVKFERRQTCDSSQQEDETHVQVEVSA